MIAQTNYQERERLWGSLAEVERKAAPGNLDTARSIDTRSLDEISKFRVKEKIGENRETGQKLVVVANDFGDLDKEILRLAGRTEYSDLTKIFDYLRSHITYTFLPEKIQDPNSDLVEVRAYGIIEPSFFIDDLSQHGLKNSDLIKLLGVLGKEAGVDSFLVPDMKKAYTGPDKSRFTLYGGYKILRFFDNFSRKEIDNVMEGNNTFEQWLRILTDQGNLKCIFNGRPNMPRFSARFVDRYNDPDGEAARAKSYLFTKAGMDKSDPPVSRLIDLGETSLSYNPEYVDFSSLDNFFDRHLDPETPPHVEDLIRGLNWTLKGGIKKELILDPRSVDNNSPYSIGDVLEVTNRRLRTNGLVIAVPYDDNEHADLDELFTEGPKLRVINSD
jgi:hypothetical protein